MNEQFGEFWVRDWRPGDRQSVADLVRVVLAEYGMAFEPEHTDRDAIQVEECYWQTGGTFLVVEHCGHIVGSGAYHPCQRGDRAAELRKMFVLPDYRGRGLGRFLLNALESAALEQGIQEMWLETASVLTAAIALYERCGYHPSTGVETARCDRIYVKRLVPAEPASTQSETSSATLPETSRP